MNALIEDYLAYNPTRNRALDLMPFFVYLDPSVIKKLTSNQQQLVKPPTYHYRLPNCEIDDANWSLAKEFNRWVGVEKLANDKNSLYDLRKRYLTRADQSWVKIIKEKLRLSLP